MTREQKRIYLSAPHMSGEEQRYIDEAFATNWVAPLGPNVEAFEQEVAAYVGAKGALALQSGTAAIHLALRLLDIGPGDKVFCSALTFVASANPVLFLGGEPVFIDSEPNSWNMSPAALERAFADARKEGWMPKAVVIVNLYGQSADMEPLLALCDRYGVPVVEDAAESLGATYQGKTSGTFGRFGIYSFNGNKIITTSGGGMLISDDTEALAKARFWATQARDQAIHYQHSEVGYNYRLSNICAGIGRAQLRVLEERVNQRRAVFQRYMDALGEIEGITFMPEMPNSRSTRWLTTLLVDPDRCGVKVAELIDHLQAEQIEARPVWKPMQMQPLFAANRYYPHAEGFSFSEQAFATGICLPSSSNLTAEEQDRVIACLLSRLEQSVSAGQRG